MRLVWCVPVTVNSPSIQSLLIIVKIRVHINFLSAGKCNTISSGIYNGLLLLKLQGHHTFSLAVALYDRGYRSQMISNSRVQSIHQHALILFFQTLALYKSLTYLLTYYLFISCYKFFCCHTLHTR